MMRLGEPMTDVPKPFKAKPRIDPPPPHRTVILGRRLDDE